MKINNFFMYETKILNYTFQNLLSYTICPNKNFNFK